MIENERGWDSRSNSNNQSLNRWKPRQNHACMHTLADVTCEECDLWTGVAALGVLEVVLTYTVSCF